MTTTRKITVGAAQMGSIARNDSRQIVVSRMLDLLRQANDRVADLIVYPELALTTFFPRWWMEDPAEIDSFSSAKCRVRRCSPLFDEAKRLEIGFSFGYGEACRRRR